MLKAFYNCGGGRSILMLAGCFQHPVTKAKGWVCDKINWPQMHINSLKVSKCALEEDLLPSGHKTQVVENQAQAFSIRLVELQWKFKAWALRVWAVKSKDTDWQRVDFCNFWWIILVVSMTTITKMQAAARNCLHLIIWGRPHSSLVSISILARFSIAVIHHMTKSILRRKGLIQLYSSVYCGKKRQDRKLNAAVETKAMEESCLLGYCPWLMKSTFLCNTGPPAQG